MALSCNYGDGYCSLNDGDAVEYTVGSGGGGPVTPLVLLLLKLEHNIISMGISCVCHT
jgi:hypothetical protein